MKLTIFFSWEMETDPQGFNNKTFLIACINRALKQLAQQKAFKGVQFDFQEGLSDVSGTPRVAEIMMERARKCDIFIGDMTIAQKLGRFTRCEMEHQKSFLRMSPNANVLMEYAIAFNKENDFWEQVVLIMNKVNGDVHDNVELFPFDIRDERFPITFELTGEANKEHEEKVTNILIEPLRLAAEAAIKRHKNKYKPLMSWEDQKNGSYYYGEYVWTDRLNEYKEAILGENDIIRLIGLSGNGKTRLLAQAYYLQIEDWKMADSKGEKREANQNCLPFVKENADQTRYLCSIVGDDYLREQMTDMFDELVENYQKIGALS